MKLDGTHWWVQREYIDGAEVKEAIISKEGKEINIDYMYERKREHVKLISVDGIHFSGACNRGGKVVAKCNLTLYKNEAGYLLYGGVGNDEGFDAWWLELKLSK